MRYLMMLIVVGMMSSVGGCYHFAEKQEINLTSEPSGASVTYLDNMMNGTKRLGVTPLIYTMQIPALTKLIGNPRFRVALGGYHSVYVNLPASGGVEHHIVFEKTHHQQLQDEQQQLQDEQAAAAINKIAQRCRLVLGLAQSTVRSSWGRPRDINRSVGHWGVHEQWVYDTTFPKSFNSICIYFENGKLTSWQE